MTSVSSFEADHMGAQDGKTSPSLALGGVKVKLEPLDPPAENQVETMSAPSPLLPLGVHHRMRVYSRSTQSTSPETFVCEVCQGEFPYQGMLQTHKLLHFNTRHVCYACDCYFLKAETLVLHVSTIHGSLSVVSQSHKGEIFVCSICLQRFSSKKILLKHENLHATRDEANYSCKICALDFIGYRALLAHLNSPRHREMKVKMQSIFVCVDCRSIFASRDSYAMHMMVRAQNESCDAKNPPALPALQHIDASVKSEAPSPGPAQEDLNGGYANEDDSTIPLNLSKQAQESSLTPHASSAGVVSIIQRHQHQCGRCSESFPTQDALAMHVMLHAKTEAEDEHKLSIQSKLGAALLARHAALVQQQQTSSLAARPSSAPIPTTALSLLAMHANNLWSCSLCHTAFESCDMLAMHVMDKHAGTHSSPEPRDLNDHSNGMPDHEESSYNSIQQRPSSAEAQQSRALTAVLGELHRAKQLSSRLNTTTTPAQAKQDNTASIIGKKRRLSLGQLNLEENETQRDKLFQEKRCKSADYVDPEIGVPWKRPHSVVESGHLHCDLCSLTLDNDRELHSHFKSNAHQRKMLEAISEKNDFQNGQVDDVNDRRPSLDNDTAHKKPENTGTPVKCSSSDSGVESWLDDKSAKQAGVVIAAHNHTLPDEHFPETDTNHLEARKSRRKMRNASRVVQSSCQSPEPSEMSPWMTESGETSAHALVSSTSNPVALRQTPRSNSRDGDVDRTHGKQLGPEHSPANHSPRPSSRASPASRTANQNGGMASRGQATPPEGIQDADLLEFILGHVDNLVMCRFCGIIFTDRTMYYLHMGLHNVNNPWQCNLCGKVCSDVHQFSSHVIHY